MQIYPQIYIVLHSALKKSIVVLVIINNNFFLRGWGEGGRHLQFFYILQLSTIFLAFKPAFLMSNDSFHIF